MNTEKLDRARIVVLSGEDFQRSERLREVLDTVVDPATRDFNLDIIYADEYRKKSRDFLRMFSELLVTFPMIASQRVIVVRNFDSLDAPTRKKTSELLSGTPDTTLVIIEGSEAKLSPKPKLDVLEESFKKIYEEKITGWIKNRFRKRGKTVTDSAAALIMNNVGTELGELDGEIEKAVIIAGDRETVTEEDVRLVVGEFRRDTVYNLCNAIGLNDFKGASRILASLVTAEKNKETYYLYTLFGHILKIAEYHRLVRTGAPQVEAEKAVSGTPFLWKHNSMPLQVENFNHARIRRSLTALARTESMMKKSGIDNQMLMELLLPLLFPAARMTTNGQEP